MADDGLTCALKAQFPGFTLDVSFSVKKGELVCLIGPSGCGKSTTLGILSGLVKCSKESTITLEGKEIANLPPEKRQVALVFQDYAVFPHMNVGENVAYPLKLQKVPRRKRKEKVAQYLDIVSLRGFEKRKPNQLSGGERQRVALARALASKPKLMLLDEPLSALDAKLRKHLCEEIKRIHDETGMTMVYVTHDQQEAMAIADRIVVMEKGHVEQIGKPEELYRNPKNLKLATFMGEGTTLPAKLVKTYIQNQKEEEPCFTEEDLLFFRPEKVTIQEDARLPLPEYLPHVQFRDAKLVSTIFQGSYYEALYQWEGHTIRAIANTRPAKEKATLGVRLADILIYEGTEAGEA